MIIIIIKRTIFHSAYHFWSPLLTLYLCLSPSLSLPFLLRFDYTPMVFVLRQLQFPPFCRQTNPFWPCPFPLSFRRTHEK
ncbi:hypothetical protein, unlikely [Trypanosoma brucei brucei TREU927]|uniref:Uncharacterized protein n=1 Tax=Trypanosoma brucei brucei (strain 927/4 GUTat10.1) TaxID=185431 RepID=Q38EI7_TRYB2|nr:hypothetical protein, unlikely [Trypanosoma brucei brucei TREU927]EAN76783.1 hypothetical protein, unlikely [Trypanosoma brucei brucei TREU927]